MDNRKFKSIFIIIVLIWFFSISTKYTYANILYPDLNCSKDLDYFTCINHLDKAQSRKYKSQVIKNKEKLILLNIQKSKQVKKFSVTGTNEQYFFLGYMEKQNFFLIDHWFSGQEEFLLVNGTTGNEFFVPGIIIESPDNQRIVSSSIDVVSGGQFRDNLIKIFKFEREKLIEEWSLSPPVDSWGPSNPRWIDSKTVVFTKDFGNSCSSKIMKVRFINGKWQFQE